MGSDFVVILDSNVEVEVDPTSTVAEDRDTSEEAEHRRDIVYIAASDTILYASFELSRAGG